MITVTIIRQENGSKETYYVTLYEQEKLTPQSAREAVSLAGLTDGDVYFYDVAYRVTPRTVKKI